MSAFPTDEQLIELSRLQAASERARRAYGEESIAVTIALREAINNPETYAHMTLAQFARGVGDTTRVDHAREAYERASGLAGSKFAEVYPRAVSA